MSLHNSQVRVLYFASAREAAGTAEEAIALPSSEQDGKAAMTLQALLELVVARHVSLQPLMITALVAVNMEYVEGDTAAVLLQPGDEVAIIPPVSGG
ncbi:sulfur carrier protein this [Thamnocephalis sphaerospora]|uniref:Molybdopterin synthase sulfur carrier subunit n=1 Tax=Thamnocephalis sphaerospora TaxID=78915 RepID=A0A4P9XLW0_9FUNG|nr:sulfur carrier protein this [Thamnocephalis sphaerospora]|eukprot:RKP06341.1 sulfur carrier protein this [Thamnocephalis sphaerospora]